MFAHTARLASAVRAVRGPPSRFAIVMGCLCLISNFTRSTVDRETPSCSMICCVFIPARSSVEELLGFAQIHVYGLA